MTKQHNRSLSTEVAQVQIASPFLKWAGGKRKLAPLISEMMPPDFFTQKGSFFEPFIGGGAVTFFLGNENSAKYISGDRLAISDTNEDLITTYIVIRDDVDALIEQLDKISKKINEQYFYELRLSKPTNPVDRAARVIFLNKTCFNGLWRVNSSGQFNVPWGRYKNPRILDIDNLKACSKRLANSRISTASFDLAVSNASQSDFVYFDPPYLPISSSSSFSKYAKADFGISQHEQLHETIKKLTEKKVKVILSNSDTPLTRKIFGSDLNLYQIGVQRHIGAKSSSRVIVSEIIGSNYKIIDSPSIKSLMKIN